jgi:hypothetical protein
MSKFWLTLAHIAVAGAGVAGAIFFPPAAIPIIGAVSLLNGLIPSPVATVAPPGPVPPILGHQSAPLE